MTPTQNAIRLTSMLLDGSYSSIAEALDFVIASLKTGAKVNRALALSTLSRRFPNV